MTEHGSYLRDILPCSDRCHGTIPTDGAWFIPKGMYYHALTVVMRRKQLTEHGSYLRDILPCSDRCHETITTDGAWFIP